MTYNITLRKQLLNPRQCFHVFVIQELLRWQIGWKGNHFIHSQNPNKIWCNLITTLYCIRDFCFLLAEVDNIVCDYQKNTSTLQAFTETRLYIGYKAKSTNRQYISSGKWHSPTGRRRSWAANTTCAFLIVGSPWFGERGGSFSPPLKSCPPATCFPNLEKEKMVGISPAQPYFCSSALV